MAKESIPLLFFRTFVPFGLIRMLQLSKMSAILSRYFVSLKFGYLWFFWINDTAMLGGREKIGMELINNSKLVAEKK